MCRDCITVFYAQVIGIYLFLVALAMLFHQARFKKIMTDFLGQQPLVTFTGMLGIIFGLIIVVSHNMWVSDWRLLITLIGWAVLLQGALRLFFPESYVKMVKEFLNQTGYQIWCWIWLLIGLYLIWAGFSQNGY